MYRCSFPFYQSKLEKHRRWCAPVEWSVYLFAVLATFSIGLAQPPQEPSSIMLADVTEQSAIRFEHFSGGTGKHFIVETVTSGLATFDYDNDGLLDIYFLNGAPLQNAKVDNPPRNQLFRNEGGFQFKDVTLQSGVGDVGFALGTAVGDYDNDGDADIVISNFGRTVLLDNSGDGTFVRREFSGPNRPRVGAGVCMLDIERDGNLDLYVANYVDFTFDKDVSRMIFGVPAAPGPKDYRPDTDALYHNDGAGMFLDVSQSSGIATVAGAGMGAVAFDFDEDSDTDIFVCNDSAANFLFENQGDGTFQEIALLAGVAYDVTGSQQASMGVDLADFDGNGHLDLITTNFMEEIPTLYLNSGLGYFDDIGAAAGLGVADRSVTWGVAFGDLDNDSWPDLLIAAGHLLERVAQINDSEKFQAPNALLRNLGGQRFQDNTHSSAAVSQEKVSRGLAVDDLDADGLLDAVILNLNDMAQILRNQTVTTSNFVQLKLIGTSSTRDAVGARVKVLDAGRQQVQEVVIGRGYQSHFGTRLHFGLGGQAGPVAVQVNWPSGEVSDYQINALSSRYLLVEGDEQPIQVR